MQKLEMDCWISTEVTIESIEMHCQNQVIAGEHAYAESDNMLIHNVCFKLASDPTSVQSFHTGTT